MTAPINEDGHRIVEVVPYGEGAVPRYGHACPYGSGASCVSHSGENLCGGYMGEYAAEGRRFTLCQEPDAFPTE